MNWLEIMDIKGSVLKFIARLFPDVICISILFYLLIYFIIIIIIFLAVLGLHCYVGFFSVFREWRLLASCHAWRLLIMVATFAAEDWL